MQSIKNKKPNRWTNRLIKIAACGALALSLAGCVVEPEPTPPPYAYSGYPAPAYYGYPGYYYGPSVGVTVGGGGWYGRHPYHWHHWH